MTRVAIALGSNLGDREAHLEFAKARLSASLQNVVFSSTYETLPTGVPDPQGPFLNAAAAGGTDLSARELLTMLLAIERERGRERPYPLAPRTLDLDLILYGDSVFDTQELTVPHPRFRDRFFVLEPLAEIAAGAVDPVTGKTIGELARAARRP